MCETDPVLQLRKLRHGPDKGDVAEKGAGASCPKEPWDSLPNLETSSWEAKDQILWGFF